jgi:hypothetical protein
MASGVEIYVAIDRSKKCKYIYEEVVLSRKIENINVTLQSRTGRFIIIDICEGKRPKGFNKLTPSEMIF